MYILAFDTSTLWGSVALLQNQDLIAESNSKIDKTHSATLMNTIDFLLTNAGLGIGDVDLFVVSLGPGSFTGLRIGVTTGKSLAYATGKPVVGVSSLHSLAYEARMYANPDETVVPILDARRQEVYWTRYRCNDEQIHEEMKPTAEPLEAVAEVLKSEKNCLICGDGAGKYRHRLSELLTESARFVHRYSILPRAYHGALIGLNCFREGGSDDFHTLAPIYVRLPDVRPPQNTVTRVGKVVNGSL